MVLTTVQDRDARHPHFQQQQHYAPDTMLLFETFEQLLGEFFVGVKEENVGFSLGDLFGVWGSAQRTIR